MTRLTKVELRRLFSRRLTSIVVLGALVITGLLLFAAFQQAKPLTGAELANQQASFAQAQKEWAATGDQQVAECVKGQAEAQKTEPKADFRCSQMEPTWAMWGKPQVKFADLMHSNLLSGSYVLAAVGFLVGAGFVSAEFSSGSIGSWLTFQPRRTRVYGSKLAAAGLGMFPIAVALLGILTAGVWVIVGHYASTAGTTAKVWGDLGLIGSRAVALTLAAALAGAASGFLLRHTAAVIGIAMGYLVLVEAVFGQALRTSQPWLLKLNVDSWLQHGATYYVDVCKTDAQGNYGCQSVEKILSFGHSSAYLGVLVVLIVALAALVFRRRDVS
jgi:ABC-2 type transport system permease protein